jgi:tRNA threonylcarbamoyladenosine biosynthesis protein TsaE
MIDQCKIRLASPQITQQAAKSLSLTLYNPQTTILLSGELGAGKTTFIQAFAESLGIHERVTSPTYALEQRYALPTGGEFIHIDLYRLSASDASHLLHQTDDFHGIRCIEWPERLPEPVFKSLRENGIHITLEEQGHARILTCVFNDILLVDDAQIQAWRKSVHLGQNVMMHCETVGRVAKRCAETLLDRGRFARPKASEVAGKLHDLLRFLDFKPQTAPNGHKDNPADVAVWNLIKNEYPAKKHEAAVAEFLRKHGYGALATIIEPHGSQSPPSERNRTEQDILFYADKRVVHDSIVTVEGRFEDSAIRYSNGTLTPAQEQWYKETKQVETALFGNTLPDVRDL